jgi:nucleoside-triphosphatase
VVGDSGRESKRRPNVTEPKMRILVEGRPGIGKTTVARRLVEQLRADGFPLRGFTTEEMREKGRRVGFAIERVPRQSSEGKRGVLAHVDLPGPPRVGRYGVDIPSFESLVLSELRQPRADEAVVIDELGKMELASAAFREAVTALFDSEASIVATVHVYRHPFTEALKARPDVDVVRVTRENRDEVPKRLLERLMFRSPDAH